MAGIKSSPEEHPPESDGQNDAAGGEQRQFSFTYLNELTACLTGSERCAVFHALPGLLRRQAWSGLAQRLAWLADDEGESW